MQGRSFLPIPLLPFRTAQVDLFAWPGTILLFALLLGRAIKPNITWLRYALIATILFLVLLDLHRLQVWVWFYLLWFAVFEPMPHLLGFRMLAGAMYLWGGLNKVNAHFLEEVVPDWQSTLQLSGDVFKWMMAVFAVFLELYIGFCLLFFPKKRFLLIATILLHGFILFILLLQGGWNTVVWPWNIALPVAVWLTFKYQETPKLTLLSPLQQGLGYALLALPATYSLGIWPYTLSWMMYSGLQPELTLSAQKQFSEQLSPKVAAKTFTIESETNLIFDDWTFAEANVPPFQHPFVFRRMQEHWCNTGADRHTWLLRSHRFCLTCGDLERTECKVQESIGMQE